MTHISYLQAIFIGMLQGVSELFPISSLGHTILIPAWVGGDWEKLVHEHYYLEIAVAMHLATAVALFLVFGKKWIQMLNAFIHLRRQDPDFRLLMLVLAATMPTAAIGLVFSDYFERIFGSPKMSSVFLTINGLILFLVAVHVTKLKSHVWATSSSTIEIRTMTIFQALGIGVAQCAAYFPGISRFGITLGFTLLLGISLATAVNFAFLLSFPLILGAAIYKLPDLFTPQLSAIRGPIIVGSIISLGSTLIAIFILKRWSRSGSLRPFAFYCATVGILSFIRFWA